MKKYLLLMFLMVPFAESQDNPTAIEHIEHNETFGINVLCIAGYVFVKDSTFKSGKYVVAEEDADLVQLMKYNDKGGGAIPMPCSEYRNKMKN